jgi:serine/threonine-protein kinase
MAKKKRRTLLVFLLGAFCFVAGDSLFNFLLMPLWVGHGKEVTVPDLRGKTLAQAEVLLRDAGLFYTVAGEQYDAKVPSGYVLRQDPPPQMRTKPGRKVLLVVSKGQELIAVPYVIGLSFSQAASVLERSGLKVGRTETSFSDSIPRDCVLSTVPSPGATLTQGGTVNIVLSLGAGGETWVVPDLIGKSLNEARALLLGHALVLGEVQYIRSQGIEAGTVLLQNPQAGVSVQRGDTVSLAVSTREGPG